MVPIKLEQFKKEIKTLSTSKASLGILISGRGSNMDIIIRACQANQINADVAIVISNNPNANGLILANSLGIKALAVNPRDFNTKHEYENTICELLVDHSVDLVCLAGYMKIVGNTLLKKYDNKIINIHPSLLPSFKGLNAQKQALEYGVKFAGCSVHYVNDVLDGGKIILQDIVPVSEDDTEETLSHKILEKEHQIYPKAIQKVLASFKKSEE